MYQNLEHLLQLRAISEVETTSSVYKVVKFYLLIRKCKKKMFQGCSPAVFQLILVLECHLFILSVSCSH